MQDSERSLLIVLCLGIRLTGNETEDEIRAAIEHASATADRETVNSQQTQLGRWLQLAFASGESRQAASVEMWEKVDRQRYSLADVPVKLRRMAFGGGLDLQRRALRTSSFPRLLRRLAAFTWQMIMIAVLAVIAWYTFLVLKPS